MPDDELLATAQATAFSADELDDKPGACLGSPAPRKVARHFSSSCSTWLVAMPSKGSSKPRSCSTMNDTRPAISELGTPSYTDEIARLRLEEIGSFVEHVAFDGAGTLQALLTEPSTWLNGKLAALHGLPGVSADTFQKALALVSR